MKPTELAGMAIVGEELGLRAAGAVAAQMVAQIRRLAVAAMVFGFGLGFGMGPVAAQDSGQRVLSIGGSVTEI
ncbi:MAG: hypothetical protein AAFN09_17490, partial [Pseudomonadota bacterium]